MRVVKTSNLSKTSFHSAILPALLAAGIGFSALQASSGEKAPATKSFEVPLFSGTQSRLEGVLSKKEYAFKLPEHVNLEPGSELTLVWHASPLLLPDVSTMSVQLNDRDVTSVRLGTKKTRLMHKIAAKFRSYSPPICCNRAGIA